MTDAERQDLLRRLKESVDRISAMCEQGRGPRMSVPADPKNDDDLFMSQAIRDAGTAIEELVIDLSRCRTSGDALYAMALEANGRMAAALADSSKMSMQFATLGFRAEPHAPNCWQEMVTELNDAKAELESLRAQRKYWERALQQNERLRAAGGPSAGGDTCPTDPGQTTKGD